MFPVGAEVGFSSAGAGALGSAALLSLTPLPPAQVVGTDIIFGLVLAIIGSTVHWTLGSISAPVLLQLLSGGVPGVIIGCLLAKRVPAQKLKMVVAAVALAAGLQLLWSGVHTSIASRSAAAARLNAPSIGASR